MSGLTENLLFWDITSPRPRSPTRTGTEVFDVPSAIVHELGLQRYFEKQNPGARKQLYAHVARKRPIAVIGAHRVSHSLDCEPSSQSQRVSRRQRRPRQRRGAGAESGRQQWRQVSSVKRLRDADDVPDAAVAGECAAAELAVTLGGDHGNRDRRGRRAEA